MQHTNQDWGVGGRVGRESPAKLNQIKHILVRLNGQGITEKASFAYGKFASESPQDIFRQNF